jgi:hypothetical protein
MVIIISLIEEINGHQGVHMATLEWASRSSEGTKCYILKEDVWDHCIDCHSGTIKFCSVQYSLIINNMIINY